MSQSNDQQLFDEIFQLFKAEAANIGIHLRWDAGVRNAYKNQIKELSEKIKKQVYSKDNPITWAKAAKKAQEARNETMIFLRKWSTPFGRAYAKSMKFEGMKPKDLIIKYVAEKFYGKKIEFKRLSDAEKIRFYANFERFSNFEKNDIFRKIVDGSSRSNAEVTAFAQRLGPIGRNLVVFSVLASLYTIAMAEDKVQTTVREVAITGAGVAGGIAGGATAGLVCGPAAPACVAVGAIIGGALAAFGVSLFW